MNQQRLAGTAAAYFILSVVLLPVILTIYAIPFA